MKFQILLSAFVAAVSLVSARNSSSFCESSSSSSSSGCENCLDVLSRQPKWCGGPVFDGVIKSLFRLGIDWSLATACSLFRAAVSNAVNVQVIDNNSNDICNTVVGVTEDLGYASRRAMALNRPAWVADALLNTYAAPIRDRLGMVRVIILTQAQSANYPFNCVNCPPPNPYLRRYCSDDSSFSCPF